MGGSQSVGAKPVVIGVDGSDHSQRAFDWYLNFRHVMSYKSSRPVILVYNIETAPASESALGMSSQGAYDLNANEQHLQKQKSFSEKLEEDLLKKCKAANTKCEFRERYGRPGECIIEESQQANAELIVVGTRGQSTLRRTILGSVSDYIVHQSDIPIAVIPPPKHPKP